VSKLKWQCRRGMKELDVLLVRYLEQVYLKAPQEQQQAFAELLECSDTDLYLWLIKRENPEPLSAARLTVLEALRAW